ncbi:ribbon-helix-helix domain-containing protein [Phormidesmis sp. 146-33]|jgi:CopG-like RHH_1 or ribbon-helix-helix domain, RHH_5
MFASCNPCCLMPAKNPRINVVMPASLKRDFEKLCELENRSMSNMLVTLAQRAVDEAKTKGRLKDEDNQGDRT